MLSWERRALLSLHQSSGRVSVLVVRSSDTNVASAFLHDDAKDHALFDTDFGGREDRVPDAANVLIAVAGLEHLGLVEVEDGFEVFPRLFARERGGRTGVGGEVAHGRGCSKGWEISV